MSQEAETIEEAASSNGHADLKQTASSSGPPQVLDEGSSVRSKSSVHYLPCGIKYDGPTEVSSYFHAEPSEKEGVLVSHFRGRELKGQVFKLPETVSGLCITRGEDDPLRWEATGGFRELTLWQHDITPDVQQFEDLISGWAEISAAVHS